MRDLHPVLQAQLPSLGSDQRVTDTAVTRQHGLA